MTTTSIIISGFGGQGTQFAGQVLAYAALEHGKEVTWIPSYGPEMRGGTARCTVIISDEAIGSPLVRNPDAVIAMNLPSLDMYEPLIKDDGVILANQSLIDRDFERQGIQSVFIPAQELAEELGNARLSNMIMVGAMLELTNVLPLDVVKKALEEHIAERHKKTIPLNYQAMDKGASFAREALAEKA
jgi:2-oxoglutarate ferredoxin oxidoreductase subunit gamma